eukprot:scaffold266699_cov14-Prasinocladus_malaysianus.AAC.1
MADEVELAHYASFPDTLGTVQTRVNVLGCGTALVDDYLRLQLVSFMVLSASTLLPDRLASRRDHRGRGHGPCRCCSDGMSDSYRGQAQFRHPESYIVSYTH